MLSQNKYTDQIQRLTNMINEGRKFHEMIMQDLDITVEGLDDNTKKMYNDYMKEIKNAGKNKDIASLMKIQQKLRDYGKHTGTE